MKQDATTYYVCIGGSCDYGHKERTGAASVIVEHVGDIAKRDVIADIYTTENASDGNILQKEVKW